MQYTSTTSDLIFISPVERFFDPHRQPATAEFKLKFVMLKGLDGTLCMLLMEEDRPFSYHAEGVLSYMKENKLTEIVINGGGVVTFKRGSCFFNQFSYAFGGANEEEVKEFANNIWKNLQFESSLGRQRESGIAQGKTYSLREIQHFVDNP
jgi:hypothetical protein